MKIYSPEHFSIMRDDAPVWRRMLFRMDKAKVPTALGTVTVLGALVWMASPLPPSPAGAQSASHALGPVADVVPPVPVPAVEPVLLEDVTAEDAVAINAAIPDAEVALVPARPFRLVDNSGVNRRNALDCMTAAIYYEAANEPLQGQRGVAQVVLNRVRHPAYPNSVCAVVFQGSERSTGCQFSFTCDGSMARVPAAALWDRARRVATASLDGYVERSVGMATHYHANYVVPYWAKSLDKVQTVGAHIFYQWQGYWGRPSAFTAKYSGIETPVHGNGTVAEGETLLGTDVLDAAVAALAADGSRSGLIADAGSLASGLHAGQPLGGNEATGSESTTKLPTSSSTTREKPANRTLVAADAEAGGLLADQNSGTLVAR